MDKLDPLFAHILIAHPDPDLIKRVRLVLQSAGYIVRSVETAQAILETIQTDPPDLILLGPALPDTDSPALLRRLRNSSSTLFIPVIVVPDPDIPLDIGTVISAGAHEIIHSPTDNAELLVRVRAMLRLKSTTDALVNLNATLERQVIERTQELEKAQASLRHTEKLAALGRLSAMIVHEVNNPLTGILSYLHLIREELPTNSPARSDMDMVEQQLHAITHLMQQLRDFARPPRLDRQAVSLNTVIKGVLSMSRRELEKGRIQISELLDPALPLVWASADQMVEVLLNLLLNARDAMPQGGLLTVHSWSEQGRVYIRVADTGTGMADEVMERIFEPFFTTKGKSGTGLGLAICHKIIHDHEGEIAVQSQVGQGSVFTITLPAFQA